MRPSRWVPVALASTLTLCGCKTYEIRLVEPAQYAQRIGEPEIVVSYEPLEYRLAAQHDRLAIRVINPTDDSITLRGDKSYVVDPKGESHPIRGWAIAPHSHMRLLLPPVP